MSISRFANRNKNIFVSTLFLDLREPIYSYTRVIQMPRERTEYLFKLPYTIFQIARVWINWLKSGGNKDLHILSIFRSLKNISKIEQTTESFTNLSKTFDTVGSRFQCLFGTNRNWIQWRFCVVPFVSKRCLLYWCPNSVGPKVGGVSKKYELETIEWPRTKTNERTNKREKEVTIERANDETNL